MLSTPRGRVLTRELVIATINKYGAQHIHVGYDIVSDLLRRKCSSFFGPSDVAFYRVKKNTSIRLKGLCLCVRERRSKKKEP